jgi:hypothetical protein
VFLPDRKLCVHGPNTELIDDRPRRPKFNLRNQIRGRHLKYSPILLSYSFTGHSAEVCSMLGWPPVCSSPDAGGGRPFLLVSFTMASYTVIGSGTNVNFCNDAGPADSRMIVP